MNDESFIFVRDQILIQTPGAARLAWQVLASAIGGGYLEDTDHGGESADVSKGKRASRSHGGKRRDG